MEQRVARCCVLGPKSLGARTGRRHVAWLSEQCRRAGPISSRLKAGLYHPARDRISGHALLRLDAHHLGTVDPALAQVDTEPTLAVLLVETNGRAWSKLLEVVLRPGLKKWPLPPGSHAAKSASHSELNGEFQPERPTAQRRNGEPYIFAGRLEQAGKMSSDVPFVCH